MKRTDSPIQFPFPIDDPTVRNMADILKRTVGFASSLVDILLSLGETPLAGAAAPGTTIASSGVTLDFEDALIDDIRLCFSGSHDTAFQSVASLFDVTDNVELLAVDVPAAAALVVSEWTRVRASAGDHALELRITGDGVDLTTIYNAHLQCRTLEAESA